MRCGQKMPAEYREFFELSLSERHERFRTFPVEKQLDVYFYAIGREPPDFGFADDIALRGKEVVPFLFERLKSEKDEYNQAALIRVFESLSARGDLRGRQDIVERIRAIVSNMKDFKGEAKATLEEIERNTHE